MITKGIIRKVPQNNEENIYSVWLPFFDDPTEDATEIVLDATLSEAAGINGGYGVGEVVYCAFEDNNTSRPVIVGKLSTPEAENVGGQVETERLTVTRKANLPHDTSVGDVDLGEVLDHIVSINGDIAELKGSGGGGSSAYVKKSGDTMTGALSTPRVTTNSIGGTVSNSSREDWWEVKCDVDSRSGIGYLDIATGSTAHQPVYVSQYSGATRETPTNRATLLDGTGNTTFPGKVTARGDLVAEKLNSVAEASQVKVKSAAGYLCLRSDGNTWGDRGLYASSSSILPTDDVPIIVVNTNEDVHFHGKTIELHDGYNSYKSEIAPGTLTANRNVTLPDASGTVVLASEIYYKSGDTYTVTNTAAFNGFTSSNASVIYFSVYTPKLLSKITSAVVTSLDVQIRGINGYVNAIGDTTISFVEYANRNHYAVTAEIENANLIKVSLTRDDDQFSNAANNTPISIYGGITIELS